MEFICKKKTRRNYPRYYNAVPIEASEVSTNYEKPERQPAKCVW